MIPTANPRLLYNAPPLAVPRINLSTTPERIAAGERWASGFVRPRMGIACDPVTLACTGTIGGRTVRRWDHPSQALRWMVNHVSPGQRWIGHLNYDLGRLFESLPHAPPDDLKIPLMQFVLCEPVRERPPFPEPIHRPGSAALSSTFTPDAYRAAVSRAIEYIAAGDVFQVNLSQRFSVGLPCDPADIYYRLCRTHPAWYAAYLAFDDYALISHSPELFLRVLPGSDGGLRVITRPIKGTRPHGDGMREELESSVKDQAELNMIVDLERNDFGRVCRIGSVKVTSPREIECHGTVYHGAATVEGILRPEVDLWQLLQATFPGGSVTGAPKIRAMQIIDELEPVARGAYCGAIGWIGQDGAMEFNLAIRTMTVKEGLIHIPVGGGIVADSDPDAEYRETLVKARSMFEAVELGDPAAGLPPL